MLSPLDKQLLNDFQHNFPLSATPYREIADSLGVTEDDVLFSLTELTEKRFISRIGPIISPNRMGISTLVAMAIPAANLASIADIISQYQEVNHNYERENRFNLWFVLIAANEGQMQLLIKRIEQQTGFTTMQLPLISDYYINLGFELELDD